MSEADEIDRSRGETLACDLTALDATQRSRRALLAETLRTRASRVVERPDGYALHLAGDRELLRQAGKWIELERKCCPFLELRLRRDEATGGAVLEITGSAEAKAFIAAQLEGP